jgi:hypothetical protein
MFRDDVRRPWTWNLAAGSTGQERRRAEDARDVDLDRHAGRIRAWLPVAQHVRGGGGGDLFRLAADLGCAFQRQPLPAVPCAVS